MNIITKMRKSLLVAAAFLCAGGAWAQETEYSPVWTNDFEDATTFSDGFASGNTGRYEVLQKDGYTTDSKAVSFSPIGTGNNGTTNTFTLPTTLSEALTTYNEEYQFDFYYYQSAGNNQTGSGIKISFSGGSSVSLLTTATSGPAIISVSDVATESSIPNETWCHIFINSKDSKTTLTITSVDGETSYISDEVIAETSDVITKIENYTKRYYGEFRFDDMTLSAPGAKEDITAPACAITAVDGVNRTVTITPGAGTVGSAAASTYYTLDETEPSNTNGTEYTAPFTVSTTTTVKAISYLADGTASEVITYIVEAGTTLSLNSNIVDVTSIVGEGDVKNVVLTNVYTSEGVVCTPVASFTYTFNGVAVELPYTVTEDGTFKATATAEGYASTSETLELKAGYTLVKSVDFTTVTVDNLTEVLGDTWSVTTASTRWAYWAEIDGNYPVATCSTPATLTDFLGTTDGGNMLVGYGVGRNTTNGATEYWINNPEEGQIALYEVNQSLKPTTDFTEYAVAYADNNRLSHTIYGTTVIAKVSVYSPERELVVTDGEDLNATGTYTSATYERTFNTTYNYGTICLPFAPDEATCANYTFYKLSETNSDALIFEEETAPEANVAYLYTLKEGVDAADAKTFTGGVTTISDVVANEVGGWSFIGAFQKDSIVVSADTTGALYYAYRPTTEKDILVKATNSLTVYPYRAYFKFVETETLNFTPTTSTMRLIIGGQDGGANAIEKVIAPEEIEGAVFDMEGRPVREMQKGQVYIIGGKKVMK